jgi:hypothetical protein
LLSKMENVHDCAGLPSTATVIRPYNQRSTVQNRGRRFLDREKTPRLPGRYGHREVYTGPRCLTYTFPLFSRQNGAEILMGTGWNALQLPSTSLLDLDSFYSSLPCSDHTELRPRSAFPYSHTRFTSKRR